MRFYQFKIVEDVAVDPQVDNEIKKLSVQQILRNKRKMLLINKRYTTRFTK